MTIAVNHALMFSAVLFGIGLIGVLTRRNLLIVFVSIELMLNAANLNLVALSRRVDGSFSPVDGDAIALFVILLAAVEVAVGLGILLKLYGAHKAIGVEQIEELKD